MQCPAYYGTRSLLQRSEEPANFPVLNPVLPKDFWRCTIILSFQLRPSLPGVLFLSGLTTKTVYACPFFPTCVNCPTHIILLYLIALIIFGKVHKSWSSSKCSCIVVNTGNFKRNPAWTYVHYCAHLEPSWLNMYWGKLFEPDFVGNNEKI